MTPDPFFLLNAEMGHLHQLRRSLSRSAIFFVFSPLQRILCDGEFTSLLSSRRLTQLGLLFKERLGLGRQDGTLALRHRAAVEVLVDHQSQR